MAMSAALDALVAPLRRSPFMVEIADLLHAEVEAERALRRKFYAEMTPEQKVEFIGGEIIMHSPARNVHLDVTKYALHLIDLFVCRKQLGEVKSDLGEKTDDITDATKTKATDVLRDVRKSVEDLTKQVED